MATENFIQVKHLVKRYGQNLVLKDISFYISQGEIFGLWGANGAGKSTLLSILATVTRPTSGEIIIQGQNIITHSSPIKRLIGLVPQEIALYTRLSGLDNLNFWGNVYGLKGKLLKQRIEEALNIVGLRERITEPVESYSGGMQRRLNIAVTLLHHPGILIMDEPTTGVDVQSRKYILETVKQLSRQGCTVIYTSHYLEELEWLCDRLAILQEGMLQAVGKTDELASYLSGQKIQWECEVPTTTDKERDEWRQV
jgi:ABC-2 type transport system ATP-binding protein